MPYVGIAISSFWRDLARGSRLPGPGVSAQALFLFELLMPYASNLDFEISARFGS